MKIQLLQILPAHNCTQVSTNLDAIVSDLLFWESDLPYPASLKNELGDWFQRWCDAPVHSVPTNLLDALKQCDRDIYPCIHQLLVIGCTLPVTSCEAERSFVRLTMNHLRSTMTEERLAALTLLHLHKDVEICPNEVVKTYISQHTRRMFKGSIIFD